MATTQTIRIIVEERGSRQAARNIRNIGTQATASERALALLRRAFAALSVGLLAREFIRLSDAYRTLQNRLTLVTESERARLAVTRELADIAAETFSSLEATGELYARLALNTRQLGVAQEDVLTVTRALNQAVILSGAGVREASNALIQLSQGLASNALRGDELRAVLEQLPFVADVIAERLGVTRGAIRLLAFRGEIDAQTVVDAFLNASDRINEQFQQLQPTIGQAFQVLRTRLTQAVGEFNEATGAAGGLANALVNISDSIEDVTDILIVFSENVNITITAVQEFLGSTDEGLQDTESNFRSFLRFFARGIDLIPRLLTAAIDSLLAAIPALFDNIVGFGERALNEAARTIESIVNFIIRGINSVLDGLTSGINAIINDLNAISQALGQGRVLDPISLGNLVDLELGRVEERNLENIGEVAGEAFTAGFNRFRGVETGLEDIFERADQRALARDAEGRDFGGTPQQAGEELLSLQDIRLIQLREEIESQARLNLLGSERTVIAAQEIASERLRRKLIQDSVQVENEFQQTMLDELDALVRQNEERRIRAELDQQVSDLTTELEDQLQLLSLSTTEREVEGQLLQVINSYKEVGLEIDQNQLNLVRALTREVQERTLEEQALNQVFGDRARLQAEVAATQRVRERTTDPEDLRGLDRRLAELRIAGRQGDPSLTAGFENALDNLFLKVSDVAGGIEQALTNAFQAAEDALVDFVLTGEVNFSQLVDSILADLTRLLARQAILALFNALSGGTAAGGAGLLAEFLGPGGSLGGRQTGGPVSAGTPYLVGERGPEIFAPGRSGTVIPNSALPPTPAPANVTVVNVLDPSMVTAALNDPEAQQVIVNVIGNNRAAVNRTLGNR